MELDAKAELIEALIPLGLMAVSQTLEAEVTELAGERYRRDGGRPALARYGSNRSSVRLAGRRVPVRVPRVRNVAEGKEVPLASLQALRAATGPVDATLLRRVLYDGRKVLLGFVEAGTENAEVLTRFLRGVLDRGLSIEQGVPSGIDGSKGLRAAVRRAFGKKPLVHRCQWHKRENVLGHLPKGERAWWHKRLQRACERPTYEEAKTALGALRAHLPDKNLSAAKSLDEGFEETPTLHRRGVFPLLGIRLRTTNCLESIFSQVETRTGRVCNWKNSSQTHRWLASALLDIEPRLRRIRGYRHLARLREAVQRQLGLLNTEANERSVA